jgi:hypothetical protein
VSSGLSGHPVVGLDVDARAGEPPTIVLTIRTGYNKWEQFKMPSGHALILMERLSEALAKAKTTQGWCDLCQEFHTAPVCEHGFMIGHCTACLLAKRPSS